MQSRHVPPHCKEQPLSQQPNPLRATAAVSSLYEVLAHLPETLSSKHHHSERTISRALFRSVETSYNLVLATLQCRFCLAGHGLALPPTCLSKLGNMS